MPRAWGEGVREGALPFWRDGGFRRLASRDAPIAGRAQCQSARYAPRRPQAPCCARDRKEVGHCGATTEPGPFRRSAAALRPGGGALPTTGGTNQVHQMFHVKHPYWFPCLTHILDKPSCSVSAQFSPKCCGFAARGSAQGDETNDDLGKRSLSGKAPGCGGRIRNIWVKTVHRDALGWPMPHPHPIRSCIAPVVPRRIAECFT